MKIKEILEALRGGAGVAHREDVHLWVSPEVCAAAIAEIEALQRKANVGWQSDVSGSLVGKPNPAQNEPPSYSIAHKDKF